MKTARRLLLLCVLSLAAPAAAGELDIAPRLDFEAALNERIAVYESVGTDPAAFELSLNGGYQQLHDRLEALVPDAEKTAIDHFVLGNMLYDVDPERSFAHQLRAYAALPGEPRVMLEMAYHYHRRDACREALPLYVRVASLGALRPEQYALRAHCHLRLGELAEAVQAWAMADHAGHHTAIDFAIHDVFGGVSPVARHDRLMQRVTAREVGAIDALLANALEWKRDWWNAGTEPDAFEAAVRAIERVWGKQDARAREARLFATTRDLREPKALEEALREQQLLLGDGGLPASSYLARHWVPQLLVAGLVTHGELDRFLPELLERGRTGEDVHALHIAAGILAQAGRSEELAEVDKLGWHQYREPRFARSFLAGLRTARGTDPSPDDPVLQAALRDFPHEPRLVYVGAVQAVREHRDARSWLVRLIDAEYHGLRSDKSRFSYALKRYYAELARELERDATSPASTAH